MPEESRPRVELPAGLDAPPAPGMTRLLSWNMSHSIASWPHLVEVARVANVDVALLQEAGQPKGIDPSTVTTWPSMDDAESWHTWDRPDSVGRRWCAALAWFEWSRVHVQPEVRTRIDQANWDVPAITHPGQFAVGHVTTGGGTFAAVSLYGIWDSQPQKRWIFTEATTHRALSDLTPLLHTGEPVVITGDLNILYRYPEFDLWTPRANTIFDRFSAYGVNVVGPFRPAEEVLEDCPCGGGDHCRHVNTRPDPSGRPWQLDYVLSNLPEERFHTWTLPIEPDYSDHAAVIADVHLGPT